MVNVIGYKRVYVIIMSLTSFRVNVRSIVCPNVKELFARAGAISEL